MSCKISGATSRKYTKPDGISDPAARLDRNSSAIIHAIGIPVACSRSLSDFTRCDTAGFKLAAHMTLQSGAAGVLPMTKLRDSIDHACRDHRLVFGRRQLQ